MFSLENLKLFEAVCIFFIKICDIEGCIIIRVPTSLDFPRFLQFSKKKPYIFLDKIEKIMNFPKFYFFFLVLDRLL